MAITLKNLDQPDESFAYGDAGRADYTLLGSSMVGRSTLQPGWSWDEYVQPHTDGETSCSLTHYEYVISGRIRYLTDDGEEVVAGPGDHLEIGPGHRAWVEGDEPFVAIDFEVGEFEADDGDEEG
jgi:hypothetical protein